MFKRKEYGNREIDLTMNVQFVTQRVQLMNTSHDIPCLVLEFHGPKHHFCFRIITNSEISFSWNIPKQKTKKDSSFVSHSINQFLYIKRRKNRFLQKTRLNKFTYIHITMQNHTTKLANPNKMRREGRYQGHPAHVSKNRDWDMRLITSVVGVLSDPKRSK